MPTRDQLFQLGGREEHLGAGRGILPPSTNNIPDFTGEVIGVLVRDPVNEDMKLEVTPPKETDTNNEKQD